MKNNFKNEKEFLKQSEEKLAIVENAMPTLMQKLYDGFKETGFVFIYDEKIEAVLMKDLDTGIVFEYDFFYNIFPMLMDDFIKSSIEAHFSNKGTEINIERKIGEVLEESDKLLKEKYKDNYREIKKLVDKEVNKKFN